MKFNLLGRSNSGHRTGLHNENMFRVDKTKLNATYDFEPMIEEQDGKLTLVIQWFYKINSTVNEMYALDSISYYEIVEEKTEPNLSDLKEIVRFTHKRLRETFDERRKEFTIFDALADIHPDTIEQVALQLSEVLLPLHETS